MKFFSQWNKYIEISGLFYIFTNLLLKSGITGGSGWILISASALNQLQVFILDEVYKENQTLNRYAVGKGGSISSLFW